MKWSKVKRLLHCLTLEPKMNSGHWSHRPTLIPNRCICISGEVLNLYYSGSMKGKLLWQYGRTRLTISDRKPKAYRQSTSMISRCRSLCNLTLMCFCFKTLIYGHMVSTLSFHHRTYSRVSNICPLVYR